MGSFVQNNGRNSQTALTYPTARLICFYHVCDGVLAKLGLMLPRTARVYRRGGYMKQVICLLAVFSLIALTGALAQTGIDGAILGVVSDANGGAVVGATVTV